MGTGTKGSLGIAGIYKDAFYDKNLLTPNSSHNNGVGKTTVEMQQQKFVEQLNTNTLEGIMWVKVDGSYPEQVKGEVVRQPEVQKEDSESILESIKKVNEVKDNISNSLKDTKDPWAILSVVANGDRESLTNKDEFLKEGYEIMASSNNIYEIERTIIGLSSIGIDVSKISNGINTVNGLEALANKNLASLVNATIFGLVAYDSGEYILPQNSKYTREQIITMILDKQSKKGGWALAGRGEDVDMTAMAMHSLAPYYVAKDAKEAGLSEEVYNKVSTSIGKAIKLLIDMQLEDGSYSYDKTAAGSNSNSTAMVINTLSALGVDSLRDTKFIKNDKNVVDGLFKFIVEDGTGFGYKDNKHNGMATEQSFRALVSYSKFNENKEAYNIYKVGKDLVNSGQAPTPEVKPEGRILLPRTGGLGGLPFLMTGVMFILAGFGIKLKRR